MMDRQQPIGVFDSGLGGLTVAQALRTHMPHESFIYVGDTARVPYGEKPREQVAAFNHEIARHLIARGVKALVVACNTATAALDSAFYDLCGPRPVIEVVTPTARAALEQSTQRRIGIIATHGTVKSHLYLKRLLELAPFTAVVEKATPLLVPLIEAGWPPEQQALAVLEAYLSDTGFQHIDTLVLGCTHYALIRNDVERLLTDRETGSVTVVDSVAATAAEVARVLGQEGLLRPVDGQPSPTCSYGFTRLTGETEAVIQHFFGPQLEVQSITLQEASPNP